MNCNPSRAALSAFALVCALALPNFARAQNALTEEGLFVAVANPITSEVVQHIKNQVEPRQNTPPGPHHRFRLQSRRQGRGQHQFRRLLRTRGRDPQASRERYYGRIRARFRHRPYRAARARLQRDRDEQGGETRPDRDRWGSPARRLQAHRLSDGDQRSRAAMGRHSQDVRRQRRSRRRRAQARRRDLVRRSEQSAGSRADRRQAGRRSRRSPARWPCTPRIKRARSASAASCSKRERGPNSPRSTTSRPPVPRKTS